MCDVPFCDKNHFDAESDLLESLPNQDTSIVYSPKIDSLLEEFTGELAPINPIPPRIHEADFDPEGDIPLIEQLLYDDTSSDDDSYEDIDYVEASPPDSELVNLEEVKDDILREKLLNINLLIAKIESLNDNPSPDCVPKSPSPFPIRVEDTIKRKRRHADNSLPEYDLFLFETEPDQGELTSVVMEDMLGEHRAHNVLPNHPTLMLDSDFSPSDDSLVSNLVVSIPSGTRNNIFDPGIFIEVQSKRFQSPNKFSISFIRDPLSSVFDTLLPFSPKNEEKVFNPGSLSSNEEKSPHLLSHRGFNPSKIISDFSKSPMMISGGEIPILDVSIAPDYEASRAHGFVLRSLVQSLA
ncbi:hypothetical protein Tco_0666506 [Tanacetum coccineum]